MRTMSTSQRQPIRRWTKNARMNSLGDHEAFGEVQIDISTLETQKMSAISVRKASVAQQPTIKLTGTRAIHPGLNTDPTIKPVTRKQTWKKYLSLVARVGLSILLFVFLFKSLSWTSLFMLVGKARRALILMGLIIGATGVVISSYQWRSLLRSESIRFDLADLIDLYLVGTAFSHFLPTGMGGDAVKAMYVARAAGNTEGSMSAVVMSRVTGFFGMLVIAIAILIVRHAYFAPRLLLWFMLLSLLVAGMIVSAILSVTLVPRLLHGRENISRFIPGNVRRKVIGTGNALVASVLRPRSLVIATMFGVMFWITACLNYYSYSIAIGVNIPLYFYFVAIPFVSLIAFLPVSINGFGIREGAFVYVFSTLHVSATSSLFIVLLMDAQVVCFGVLGGCIYIMLNKRRAVSISRV